MLTVKTSIGQSAIHGVGLFAAQDLAPGETVWLYREGFDLLYTAAEIRELPPLVRDFLETYGFSFRGKVCLSADNDRFTNHSDQPNIVPGRDESWVTGRAIKAGEELTTNYAWLEEDWDGKF
jgi:SET domain-containing protein